MRLIKAFLVTTLFVALLGCGGGGLFSSWPSAWPKDAGIPTKTTDAYFITDKNGGATFAGLPGYYLGVADRDLVKAGAANYSYVDGHKGGTGDTLEVASTVDGIYLIWAYGHLDIVDLDGFWQGRVYLGINQPTDIRIGAPATTFVAAFPNCKIDPNFSPGVRLYSVIVPEGPQKSKSINAFCDDNDIITQVRFESYGR